jgi:hypothetical protein
MKEPIFNQIAENVCSIYDISKEKLFTKTILHGIDVVSKKMEQDVDYQVIREKIQECVTLS